MKKAIKLLFFSMVLASVSLVAKDVYSSKHYTKSMKEHLVSAKDALKLLGKDNVVFVSGDSHDTYEAIGHIKGSAEMYAHHLHHSDITGKMDCAPLFMCPQEAQELIGSKGISNDTLVIAYDNFRGPNATGVWAFFKSFGHENVKVLNGGMDAIKLIDENQIEYDKYKSEVQDLRRAARDASKNNETKTVEKYEKQIASLEKKMDALEPKLIIQKGKEPKHKKVAYNIDLQKIDWDLIATKDDVLEASNDLVEKGKESDYRIIDTRSMIEIIGERKMDNVARGGHVPGATFLEWNNITDFENKLSFRDLSELQKVFDKYGLKKDQKIYAYCHVGAGRSTEIVVALRMLGYKNAKVYTGSWNEWGNDMNLPINR
jgi:thiosulfate/3-mercaptopyruvate sulfurtransferase